MSIVGMLEVVEKASLRILRPCPSWRTRTKRSALVQYLAKLNDLRCKGLLFDARGVVAEACW